MRLFLGNRGTWARTRGRTEHGLSGEWRVAKAISASLTVGSEVLGEQDEEEISTGREGSGMGQKGRKEHTVYIPPFTNYIPK